VNDLAIALASLGGVVLAGVIAHGAWSARNAFSIVSSVDDRSPPGAVALIKSTILLNTSQSRASRLPGTCWCTFTRMSFGRMDATIPACTCSDPEPAPAQ